MPKRNPTKKSRSSKTSPARARRTPRRFEDYDWALAHCLLRPNEKAYEFANATLARVVVADTISELDQVAFLLSCRLSVKTLTGYSTLDQKHIEDIQSLISKIKQYANDTAQKRPLNFLMLSSPGAGKSHFIKCVAQSLQSDNVIALTYDLTALEKNDDLIPPLDAARNQKVIDKVPLLFLDEFDSRPANIPMLLPLLWNGEINLGQHDLRLGKIVIILAGSDSHLPDAMEKAKSMQRNLAFESGVSPKIVDLLSRINGGTITIPGFQDSRNRTDRRAGKICAAIHLIGRRFGKDLKMVPIGLLRFIYGAEFRYGVRSISHLIDLIPYREGLQQLQYSDLYLPMESPDLLNKSSLAYHLISDDDGTVAIVDSWLAAKAIDAWLPVFHEEDELPGWMRLDEDPSMDSEVIKHYYEQIERLSGAKPGG